MSLAEIPVDGSSALVVNKSINGLERAFYIGLRPVEGYGIDSRV